MTQSTQAARRSPRVTRPTTKPISGRISPRQHAQRPIGSKCRPDCHRPTAAQAHCSVCHVTFGGVGNFDRHRDDGYCLDPATLGMVERDKVWRTPMPEDVLARLRGTS